MAEIVKTGIDLTILRFPRSVEIDFQMEKVRVHYIETVNEGTNQISSEFKFYERPFADWLSSELGQSTLAIIESRLSQENPNA